MNSNYILNCDSSDKIKKISEIFRRDNNENLIDIVTGEYNQLFCLFIQSIISQWNYRMSAKPSIIIGADENDFLIDYLSGLSKTGKISLQIINGQDEDGKITLADIEKMNTAGISMLILSAESGGLGILNQIELIYEFCTKKGIILIGDITSYLDLGADKFAAHVGIGSIMEAGNLNLFYMDKRVVDAIGYIHSYSNHNFMSCFNLFSDYHAATQKELDRAIKHWEKIIEYIKKEKGIEIRKYSTFIKTSISKCVILSSSLNNRNGLALTFIKDKKVIPRSVIINELKKAIVKEVEVPVLRYSNISRDIYKSNAIYFSMIHNKSIQPIILLIDQLYQ